MAEQRPAVWQMIRQAVEALGTADTGQIRDYVLSRWPDVSPNTISTQVRVCSVNSPSRVHYPQNARPRLANGAQDCLYLTSRGRFTLYDPDKHGQWELRVDSLGRTTVGIVGDLPYEPEDSSAPDVERLDVPAGLAFPWETHLRDFLARNLHTLPLRNGPLRLYQEENVTGVEFQTDVGRIDLLAVDSQGELVVFELKLGRGPDYTIGQILRYMGWVRQNMGFGKPVRGVIIAQTMDDKLRYAASEIPAVQLLEYEVQFTIREAD